MPLVPCEARVGLQRCVCQLADKAHLTDLHRGLRQARQPFETVPLLEYDPGRELFETVGMLLQESIV